MGFPFLSVITLSPFLAAIVILLLPAERKTEAKMLALAAMILGLVLSSFLYWDYNINWVPEITSGTQWSDALAYVEDVTWIESLGINYTLGVDGMSMTLVLLTAIVGFAGVLISWGIDDRPREFFAFFMLLVGGVHGVFVAVDGFLLFFFYEVAILPMYLMIVIWGWKERREYAAMKLTLYILIGSFVALIPFIILYFQLPEVAGLAHTTFDLREWAAADFPADVQRKWFLPIFLGFIALGGMFPFHNWSPDGHVAAPTAVSMIHAGVLMKLGAYAAMRVAVQILPIGAVYWFPFIILLTLVNVVYGAFIAMRQRDMKYMIGYSSVSHMGLVAMAFATMSKVGYVGAGIQMVSHGLMTAMFFSCVGMIYDRAHSRDMDKLSGMVKALPWVAVAFIIGGFVSMGLPGLSGFVAEFPIFLGVWTGGGLNLANTAFGLNPATYYKFIAIASALGIILTAAYILRAVGSVFFGEYDEHEWHDMRPLLGIDKFVLIMFVSLLFAIGMFPAVIARIVEAGVQPVIDRVLTAQETYTVWHDVQTMLATVVAWFGGA
ncbi:MAG TPA: NADH-quinone oxidoreductase subunit M [Anaerolineae bacterium]|nr:NADH-quinone oxidoreductase subunit M [Anaerolineae bacterium]